MNLGVESASGRTQPAILEFNLREDTLQSAPGVLKLYTHNWFFQNILNHF